MVQNNRIDAQINDLKEIEKKLNLAEKLEEKKSFLILNMIRIT